MEYKSIDDYIALQPQQARATLELLRQTIKDAAPEAAEVISYQMPAFKYHGMIAYFAVCKTHYGLYVIPEIMESFKSKLTQFKGTKSAIHFPINELIPHELVAEIIKFAVALNLEKKSQRDFAKKRKSK